MKIFSDDGIVFEEYCEITQKDGSKTDGFALIVDHTEIVLTYDELKIAVEYIESMR